MSALNAPFNPTRAIVMSELANRDKGVYYNLMANNSGDLPFIRNISGDLHSLTCFLIGRKSLHTRTYNYNIISTIATTASTTTTTTTTLTTS